MREKSSPACDGLLRVLWSTVAEPLLQQATGRSESPLRGEEAGSGGDGEWVVGSGAGEGIGSEGAATLAAAERDAAASAGEAGPAAGSLAAAFAAIRDPRRKHRRVHSLAALLQVAVAAMLAGRRSLSAIGRWAAARLAEGPELLEALGVAPGRCPSVPTLQRVFSRVDPAELAKAVGKHWEQGKPPSGVSIGMDGKTARGTIPRGESDGVHLVSASVVQTGTVLAQAACMGKGHELATGRRVLQEVPKAGNLFLNDALYTQRDICAGVVEGGGAYLFVVKENQPQLLADLKRSFADLELDETPKLPQRVGDWYTRQDLRWRHAPLTAERLPEPLLPAALHRRLEQQGVRVTAFLDAPRKPAHGRFERREIWLMAHPELNKHAGEAGEVGEPWPYLAQVAWIKRERVTLAGSSAEVTYAITSLSAEEADATRVGQELRGYWACVENRLHGVRDVTFGEDASRARSGALPAVMSVLRNVVLGILRRCGVENIAAELESLGEHPAEAVRLVLDTADT